MNPSPVGNTPPEIPRTVHRGLWVLVIGVALAASAAIGWWTGHAGTAHTAAAELPSYGPAPQYQFVDQLGHTVHSGQFRGKVQIVTFLFPYCTTYCPLIAAHLAGFENTLRAAGLRDQVELIAFNVAPRTTGPRQMRAFLREYGWDPQDLHWQFLTGPAKQVRRVVTGGFHIAYQRVSLAEEARNAKSERAHGAWFPQPVVENPLAERAKPDYDVSHNDALEIVGPDGNIRKVFTQADRVSDPQLLRIVQSLLHGGAAPAT
ncbi:MAG: hypothetical protein B7Z66_02890 [Chromatiales bacterium 21-64-14]|nr:MAG: hypothetical protein B7Z66_02890 [Chromatiales bacterium 21-64-14]HQU15723.1 SCO family protein [Gammaproteobacteria bacterium]